MEKKWLLSVFGRRLERSVRLFLPWALGGGGGRVGQPQRARIELSNKWSNTYMKN